MAIPYNPMTPMDIQEFEKLTTLKLELDYLAEHAFTFEHIYSMTPAEISQLLPTQQDAAQIALIQYLSSPEFEIDLIEGILEIHERYGELMLAMIQELCPVVTGFLRDSFFLTVSVDGVAIDSDCEYYPYIESLYQMVTNTYAFYEPMILAEINALIASMVTPQ